MCVCVSVRIGSWRRCVVTHSSHVQEGLVFVCVCVLLFISTFPPGVFFGKRRAEREEDERGEKEEGEEERA